MRPQVCNDVTAAQPAIDTHNRSRQHDLAMEKRILTERFSLRHGVSLHGILFTDAFKAYKHFKAPSADFKEAMADLAMALVQNPQVVTGRGGGCAAARGSNIACTAAEEQRVRTRMYIIMTRTDVHARVLLCTYPVAVLMIARACE